jgi:hypothetical protein
MSNSGSPQETEVVASASCHCYAVESICWEDGCTAITVRATIEPVANGDAVLYLCNESRQQWPTVDVIAKLVEAAEILLHRCDYDGHGYEEIAACVERAKELLSA